MEAPGNEKRVSAVSLHAWSDGLVLSAGVSDDSGYGNYCIIEYDTGITTLYGHMIVTPFVIKGQRVTKGQTIGLISSVEHYTRSHVHYVTSDKDILATATK